MLEVLVLKDAVECTSQRLKRTSGARVITFLSKTDLLETNFSKLTLLAYSRGSNPSQLWSFATCRNLNKS